MCLDPELHRGACHELPPNLTQTGTAQYINVILLMNRSIPLCTLQIPVLVVLNKLVKTFGEKSNLKFGLIQTRQLH